jgi:hypothetical protein
MKTVASKSKDMVEKKIWSKRRPGNDLSGVPETLERIAMVDMALPNRVDLFGGFSEALGKQTALYAK